MTALRPLGLLERWYSTTNSQYNVLVSFTLSLRAAPQHLPAQPDMTAAMVACLPHFPHLALAIRDDDRAPGWVLLPLADVEAQAANHVEVVVRHDADTALRALEDRQRDRRGIKLDGSTILWSVLAVMPVATAATELVDFEVVLTLHHGVFDGVSSIMHVSSLIAQQPKPNRLAASRSR